MHHLRSKIFGGVFKGYTIRNPVSNPRLFLRSLLQTLELPRFLPRSKSSNRYPVSFQNFDLFTSAAFLIFPFKNMSPKPLIGSCPTNGTAAPSPPVRLFFHTSYKELNYLWATCPALFVPMILIGCLFAFLL